MKIVTCELEPGRRRILLEGELDHHASRKVIAALRDGLDRAPVQNLELDLAGVSFSESSGIAVALLALRTMTEMGGTLRITHTPPQMQRLFRTAGVERILQGCGGGK